MRNGIIAAYKGIQEKFNIRRNNTQMVKKDEDHFSHQFSPCGRAGGFHLMRY